MRQGGRTTRQGRAGELRGRQAAAPGPPQLLSPHCARSLPYSSQRTTDPRTSLSPRSKVTPVCRGALALPAEQQWSRSGPHHPGCIAALRATQGTRPGPEPRPCPSPPRAGSPEPSFESIAMTDLKEDHAGVWQHVCPSFFPFSFSRFLVLSRLLQETISILNLSIVGQFFTHG